MIFTKAWINLIIGFLAEYLVKCHTSKLYEITWQHFLHCRQCFSVMVCTGRVNGIFFVLQANLWKSTTSSIRHAYRHLYVFKKAPIVNSNRLTPKCFYCHIIDMLCVQVSITHVAAVRNLVTWVFTFMIFAWLMMYIILCTYCAVFTCCTDCLMLLYGNYRAIQGQVDDQDVYCRFGLKWSSTENDFVVDSLGCQAVMKYGKLIKHCFFHAETL